MRDQTTKKQESEDEELLEDNMVEVSDDIRDFLTTKCTQCAKQCVEEDPESVPKSPYHYR